MKEDFPSTRKIAKETGSLFYFTGNPCKHGHVSKRYTSGGACYECEQIKYWTNREEKCAYVREYKKKNAEQVLEYNRKYRENNREKDRAWKKKYRDNNKGTLALKNKRHRENNKEYYQEYHAKYYLENKDWITARNSNWAKKNPDKVRARSMRYVADKIKRTLSFSSAHYDKLNKDGIAEAYRLAEELNNSTGETHEVDHILPLRGKYVSGLHVWYNLQVLPMSENRKKSNKLIFDYIDPEDASDA